MIEHRAPVLLSLLLALLSAPAMSGDPEAGKAKSQTCAACHGADGNSPTAAWPNLAGQHESYTAQQLRAFKSGVRSNPQMSPMASPLSDEDIADLAAYYSAQEPAPGRAEPANLELGEALYRAGNAGAGLPACMACHGPNGAGNPAAAYPALGGQHADYTVAQMKAFKSEERANDRAAVMRTIAGRMSLEEITAVADYIQGLH